MITRTEKMIVDEIEKVKNSKTGGIRLYAKGEKTRRIPYYVFADKKDGISKGDRILYEPMGVNFGYFIKKVE